jgi:hypothetical protein
MTSEKPLGTKSESNTTEPAKKVWRRPELRKLPIGATALGGGKPTIGTNDGSGSKSGSAGSFS